MAKDYRTTSSNLSFRKLVIGIEFMTSVALAMNFFASSISFSYDSNIITYVSERHARFFSDDRYYRRIKFEHQSTFGKAAKRRDRCRPFGFMFFNERQCLFAVLLYIIHEIGGPRRRIPDRRLRPGFEFLQQIIVIFAEFFHQLLKSVVKIDTCHYATASNS